MDLKVRLGIPAFRIKVEFETDFAGSLGAVGSGPLLVKSRCERADTDKPEIPCRISASYLRVA